MKGLFLKTFSIFTLSSFVFSTGNALQSKNSEFEQVVIMPNCLLNKINFKFEALAQKNELSIIKASHTDLMNFRDETGHTACGQYRDISDEWIQLNKSRQTAAQQKFNAVKILNNELKSIQPSNSLTLNADTFQIQNEERVNLLLQNFNAQEMWNKLLKLTSFENRYANSTHGVKAAEWIQSYAEEVAKAANRNDVTTELIKTGLFFEQPSVVVKIPGNNESLDAILVGGHMDTTNGRKPGADDDGSGSATALEVMRAVLTSGMKFERTIYFAWYAAEEQGLIGSGVVAKKFKERKIPLKGILHFDMTGYQEKPINKIYMLDDNVNSQLTNFVVELAQKYAKVEVGHTRCGYACSDHASWTRNGYASAATFESTFEGGSPYIHQTNDTPDTISVDHMSRFAKVGIAFVGELANVQ